LATEEVGGIAEGAVVFYTVKGNTQRIAETIAQATQLPAERLSKERTVDIAPYNYIFFGAPVYNEHFPKAALQFGHTGKWGGKKVAIFSTNIGWKDKRAIEEFAQIIAGKGAHVVTSLSIQNRGVLTQVGFGKLTEAEHEKARKWALETQPKLLGSEGLW
jgi:flavodoxin